MNRADPEIFWFSTAAQPMTSSIFQRPLSYTFQHLHNYNGVIDKRNQFSIIISSFTHDLRLYFNPDPSFRPPSRPNCYRKKNTA